MCLFRIKPENSQSSPPKRTFLNLIRLRCLTKVITRHTTYKYLFLATIKPNQWLDALFELFFTNKLLLVTMCLYSLVGTILWIIDCLWTFCSIIILRVHMSACFVLLIWNDLACMTSTFIQIATVNASFVLKWSTREQQK